MISALDFGGLQDLLSEWPSGKLPPVGSDGVFDRICQVLHHIQFEGGIAAIGDLMPLVRHALRRQALQTGNPARLRVPAAQGWPSRDRWAAFGVRAQAVGHDQFLIEAIAWTPEWVPPADRPLFEDAFAEREVQLDWRRPIDPFLGDASGFTHYVSPGQREAVRSALLLPPGETLIVSLPTGSGKSLVAQAPVLTQGLEGELTLCVVPTTALVLDQARQMAELLRVRYPRREVPALAWHAGLSSDERLGIKTAIRQSRQGVLYCSPEAMTGALLPALYDAARLGLISYLVVDEAHLVSQWGDGFRPAFQMLAGVRRGLLDACQGPRFRTILMSATLTPDTIQTIDALFGPAQRVQMVASIYLRPEPQYWIHREPIEAAKVVKTLEAVRHAPRPIILYVTKRDDARTWLRRFRREGFLRSECFHGETSDTDRRRIIDLWSKNELDAIVATSAFGVGIDKRDVRAIIHAAVPETFDRFYQEVGRGGRDGRVSASLLIYSDVDREIADRLSAPALISDELAFERWSAMLGSANPLDAMGRLLEVDLDVVPRRLRQQTDYNASWNMRTLIMMARARMLELESRPPAMIARNEDETDASFDLRNEEHWSHYFRRTVVSMLEMGHANQAVFDARIGQERNRSFDLASRSRELMNQLLSGKTEISRLLDDLYRSHAHHRTMIVSRACGGCPVHREEGTVDLQYSEPLAQGIEEIVPYDASLFRDRFPHLNISAPVIVPLPDAASSQTVLAILGDLVATFGIREIATPDRYRAATPALMRLHSRASDGILLLQSLEEDIVRPSAYKLARASLLPPDYAPEPVFLLDRPLHILLAPASVADPFRRGRRLIDTGNNILTIDQFISGSSGTSILNMPSDGLFNVLIVLTRAIVRFGAMSRNELLKACGADLEIVDPKQLNQTLIRWTELGLFSTEDASVAICEPYRGRLGKGVDSAEARLPKITREIALAPQNNKRFWEAEENKSSDLCRGLSWILAQDVYRTDTGSHAKIAAIEGAQVTDVNRRIFQNDTRWNGLRTWMVYLGFARSGTQVTIDPTEALRDMLPDIFQSAETLPAPNFIKLAAERLPVLDGGAYRVQLEAVLNRQSWVPPAAGHVSTSLSRAIQRLDREGMIAAEQRSDSESGITLVGAERRTWRTVTHVRRLPVGKGK